MSALSNTSISFARSYRPTTELEFMRLISKLTWTGEDEQVCLASISDALLRLPGFLGFRFEPAETVANLAEFETGRPRLAVPGASALAPVSANGYVWGQVRLFLDPGASLKVESPVRLARFMGQQIGLMLHRIALNWERQGLLSKVERTNQIIRRRKLIYAAAKLLAGQQNMSEREAISEIVRYARRNRCSLLNISESLILNHDVGTVTRPLFRRLAVQEASRQ